MLSVPLSVFIDFCCTTGTRRVGIARELRQQRGYDFYGPFVRELQALHARAVHLTPRALEGDLPKYVAESTASDKRKARIYPKLVAGYSRVLSELGKTTWAPMKERAFPVGGDVEVVVGADVGLLVEKDAASPVKLHFLNLYPYGEAVADHRVELIIFLMKMALDRDDQDPICGVVDLIRSRLVTPTIQPEAVKDLLALVRGEGAAFSSLWSQM
jgi:hypothetical protein